MRSLLQVCGWMVVGAAMLAGAVNEAAGQSFQGGMRGAVRDAQGVIPGVTVTITNEATAVNRDTATSVR